MEEVIGYVIVGLVVLGLYLGIKKLFKKKTGLFTYEDEIILDKKMLHYGPFSGAFVYPHRKFILLLSISSLASSHGERQRLAAGYPRGVEAVSLTVRLLVMPSLRT